MVNSEFLIHVFMLGMYSFYKWLGISLFWNTKRDDVVFKLLVVIDQISSINKANNLEITNASNNLLSEYILRGIAR